MYAASAAEDFERAARLRDDLGALQKALEKQAVVLRDGTDADVIALAEDPLEVAVQVFYVRGGRIRGQRAWVADRMDDGDTADLVEGFLLQMYGGESDTIPREVLVPALPPDVPTMEQLLGDRRGSKVGIRVPQRGDKKSLQETVARNAAQALMLHKTKRASDLTTRNRALEEIQAALDLDEVPLRIECYDISNLQGTEVVASMVVFEDGLARKSEYRRFVIKGADGGGPDDPVGQNDVAHMHQVITRRFRRLLDEQARSTEVVTDSGPMLVDPETGRPRKFAYAPGLVVVDGGPPQVAAAQRALDRARPPRHPRLRAREAARGGVAADPGGPGDPAADLRGALPAPAGARRGAPVRDHPPPLAALEVDGRQPARRRPRAGRGAAQDAAQALRLPEEAARRDRRRARPGAGHRPPHRHRHQGGRRAAVAPAARCVPSTPPPARSRMIEP